MLLQKTIRRLGAVSAMTLAMGTPPSQGQEVMLMPRGQTPVDYFDAAIRKFEETYIQKSRIEAARSRIALARQRVIAEEVDPAIAVNEVVQAIDPHSTFMEIRYTADSASVFGFQALGIAPVAEEGRYKVSRVFFNTAASEASVKEGDMIAAINSLSVGRLDVAGAGSMICTGADKTVRLDIQRPGRAEPMHIDLSCDYNEQHAVSSRIVAGDIGHIRIDEFSTHMSFDVELAIKEMEAEGKVKAYILDLRGNPGGYIDEAHKLIDLFVDSKAPLFLQTDIDGKKVADYTAAPGDITHGKPLVVLVDHDSWSASELTAMALQFQKRAQVVGQITAGKGNIQTEEDIVLVGGGRIGRLDVTTNLYAMPDGQSPQRKGVMPDRAVPAIAAARSEATFLNALDNPRGNFWSAAERKAMRYCVAATGQNPGGDDVILNCGISMVRFMAHPGSRLPVTRASDVGPKPRR